MCCTTYLLLAAWVMAVPCAVAQQPGRGPPNQPRPTAPTAAPYLIGPLYNPYSAYSDARTSYGYGLYPGDGYDGSGSSGGYGMGGRTGGGESASAAAYSRGGSARAVEVILTASGVPNQHGKVVWPPGLRFLGADAQLEQLEAQLQLAAEQVPA